MRRAISCVARAAAGRARGVWRRCGMLRAHSSFVAEAVLERLFSPQLQTDDLAEPLYLALLAVASRVLLTTDGSLGPDAHFQLTSSIFREFTVISLRLRIPIDSSIGFVRSCITGSRVAKKGKRCSHLVLEMRKRCVFAIPTSQR